MLGEKNREEMTINQFNNRNQNTAKYNDINGYNLVGVIDGFKANLCPFDKNQCTFQGEIFTQIAVMCLMR